MIYKVVFAARSQDLQKKLNEAYEEGYRLVQVFQENTKYLSVLELERSTDTPQLVPEKKKSAKAEKKSEEDSSEELTSKVE